MKEGAKIMNFFDKKDVIEGEDDAAKMKWRDFEVHHLIAIRGEMDEEFTKTRNKQGKCFYLFFIYFGKR